MCRVRRRVAVRLRRRHGDRSAPRSRSITSSPSKKRGTPVPGNGTTPAAPVRQRPRRRPNAARRHRRLQRIERRSGPVQLAAPNEAFVCTYLADWIAIKARWELSMDQSEFGRTRNVLAERCPDQTIAPWPPTQPWTPTSTTLAASTTTTGASVDDFDDRRHPTSGRHPHRRL